LTQVCLFQEAAPVPPEETKPKRCYMEAWQGRFERLHKSAAARGSNAAARGFPERDV